MNQQPVRHVAVVGHTIEGALTAAVLAKTFGRTCKVYFLSTPHDDGPPPAVETLPSFQRIHELLSFDVRDVIATCGGTFRLGTKFERPEGKTFTWGFGDYPPAADGLPFHQHWLRVIGDEIPVTEAHLGAALAGAGALPAFEESGSAYGLHLGGPAYLRFLTAAASHYGAKAAGQLVRVENSDRCQLTLDNGGGIEVDLLIDCSGQRGDRSWVDVPGGALAWQEGRASDNPSCSKMKLGPRTSMTIPLAGGSFSAEWDTAGEGANGWALHPWADRTVRIGAGACKLSPLAAPTTRIAQIGIEALLRLLPVGEDWSAERREFARLTTEGYARLAEWQEIALALAGLSPRPQSGPAARKLDQYESRGRLVTLDKESHSPSDYLSLYSGFGLVPRELDRLLLAIPEQRSRELVQRQRDAVAGALTSAAPQQRMIEALLARKKQKVRGRKA